MEISDERLRAKLSEDEYKVLREKGTEPPFSGKFLDHKEDGIYACKVCGSKLFNSTNKYDSHTPGLLGWPSFSEVMNSDVIELVDDKSMGMNRVEVLCKKCKSHLGHLFPDNEATTGKHYCINSVCLDFVKEGAE